jgi:hypothetical protein
VLTAVPLDDREASSRVEGLPFHHPKIRGRGACNSSQAASETPQQPAQSQNKSQDQDQGAQSAKGGEGIHGPGQLSDISGLRRPDVALTHQTHR